MVMGGVSPIEDTVIVPSKYEDFAGLFPTVYNKVATYLNRKVEADGDEIILTKIPKPIASFEGFAERTVLVFIIGTAPSLPSLVAVYVSFGLLGDRVVNITSHVPGNQVIYLSSSKNALQASINSGTGTFRTRLVYL